MKKLEVNYEGHFSDIEKRDIDMAAHCVVDYFNSPDFTARLLNASFAQTDATSVDILNKVQAVDVATITIYKWRPFFGRFSRAIAVESDGRVGLSTRFFASLLPSKVGTLAHEFIHTLGYSHTYYYSKARQKSVPYQIGEWASEYIKRDYSC